MVSTSLLGCGLDYASVRHVIHCGIAYSMIDHTSKSLELGGTGSAPWLSRILDRPFSAHPKYQKTRMDWWNWKTGPRHLTNASASSQLVSRWRTCYMSPAPWRRTLLFLRGAGTASSSRAPRNSLKVHTRRCFYCQGSCYKGSCRPPPTEHTHPATKNPAKCGCCPVAFFDTQRSRRHHLL